MLNIVVPMAGLGKRFADKGYTFPKPLIEIKGRPMIEWVVRNLTPACEHRFIFVCRREHYDHYNLHCLLRLVTPNCEIIVIDSPTEGAACTVLLTRDYIGNDDPLMIANSDQYIDGDINHFVNDALQNGKDGHIMIFKATHPKWSFAKVDQNGNVTEVAEKNPISDNATVGIYYYRAGKFFVEGAESMIRKNIRCNNEFYVCPVYNEMILNDKTIGVHLIQRDKMYGWGTPEDLDYFLQTDRYKTLTL